MLKKQKMLLWLLCMGIVMSGCTNHGSSAVPDSEVEKKSEIIEDSFYPVEKEVDLGILSLKSVKSEDFQIQYPADQWEAASETDPLTVFYIPSETTGQVVNVNVQKVAEYNEELSENDLEDIKSSIKDKGLFISVDTAELRQLDGETICYIEMSTEYNDELIDYMIEQGMTTEEDIEAAGGRDAIRSLPTCMQISISIPRNGYVYTYTGSYYDKAQKDIVLDCMKVMIQTTENL